MAQIHTLDIPLGCRLWVAKVASPEEFGTAGVRPPTGFVFKHANMAEHGHVTTYGPFVSVPFAKFVALKEMVYGGVISGGDANFIVNRALMVGLPREIHPFELFRFMEQYHFDESFVARMRRCIRGGDYSWVPFATHLVRGALRGTVTI